MHSLLPYHCHSSLPKPRLVPSRYKIFEISRNPLSPHPQLPCLPHFPPPPYIAPKSPHQIAVSGVIELVVRRSWSVAPLNCIEIPALSALPPEARHLVAQAQRGVRARAVTLHVVAAPLLRSKHAGDRTGDISVLTHLDLVLPDTRQHSLVTQFIAGPLEGTLRIAPLRRVGVGKEAENMRAFESRRVGFDVLANQVARLMAHRLASAISRPIPDIINREKIRCAKRMTLSDPPNFPSQICRRIFDVHAKFRLFVDSELMLPSTSGALPFRILVSRSVSRLEEPAALFEDWIAGGGRSRCLADADSLGKPTDALLRDYDMSEKFLKKEWKKTFSPAFATTMSAAAKITRRHLQYCVCASSRSDLIRGHLKRVADSLLDRLVVRICADLSRTIKQDRRLAIKTASENGLLKGEDLEAILESLIYRACTRSTRTITDAFLDHLKPTLAVELTKEHESPCHSYSVDFIRDPAITEVID